jgi:hypothetical protein
MGGWNPRVVDFSISAVPTNHPFGRPVLSEITRGHEGADWAIDGEPVPFFFSAAQVTTGSAIQRSIEISSKLISSQLGFCQGTRLASTQSVNVVDFSGRCDIPFDVNRLYRFRSAQVYRSPHTLFRLLGDTTSYFKVEVRRLVSARLGFNA